MDNTSVVRFKKNNLIFHAGTKINDDKIFSNGGRVLNFVIRSDNFKNARNDIIKIINQLNWRSGFFRKDIGYKVLLKFLDNYNFHFHEDLFNNVKSFINSDLENIDSIFKTWNIAIKGGSYSPRDIGSVLKVKTMNRTKIQNGTSEDDLKIINLLILSVLLISKLV